MRFITSSKKTERKIVALVGFSGYGLYTRCEGVVYFMNNRGSMEKAAIQDWDRLCRDPGRTQIYEGDSLTVEF